MASHHIVDQPTPEIILLSHFGVDFICVGFRFFASAMQTIPNTKALLSGIWALVFDRVS